VKPITPSVGHRPVLNVPSRFGALGRIAVAAALIASMLLASGAQAQDQEDRLLPREIEVADLVLYRRLLNLSEAQSAAVDQLYVEYLERFDELTRTVIEPLNDSIDPAETFGQRLMFLERYYKGVEDARDRIRRVDQEMFTQIEPILDDDQLGQMPRVRDHRERHTLRVLPLLWQTGSRFHDATVFAYDLELSADDEALLNPMLTTYERTLTARLDELHELYRAQEIEPYREFVRRGLSGMDLGDPDSGFGDIVKYTWQTHGAKCIASLRGLDELNEDLSHRVVNTLSYEGAQRWLDEYLPRVYENTGWIRKRRRAILDAFARTRGRTPEEEQRFRELFVVVEARLDTIQDKFIALDKAWSPRRAVFYEREDGMSFEEYIATRRGFINEFKDVLARLSDDLRGVLRPVVFDQWETNLAGATTRTYVATTHPGGEPILGVHSAPLLLERRDLQRLSRTLALDETAQEALDEVFVAYQAAGTGIMNALPSQTRDQYGQVPPLSDDQRSRIRRLDEDIFAAVDRVCPDDECRRRIQWMRNARQRKLLGHGANVGMAAEIDAALFILDSQLAEDEIRQVAELIDSYDTEAGRLYEQLYTARLLEYEDELASSKGRPSTRLVMERRQCHRPIARLNVRTIRAAHQCLASETSRAMLEAFDRHAFYYVIVDAHRLDTAFRRIALLEDLIQEQRGRLLDVQVTYREEYDRLTEAMLDVVMDSAFWHGGDRWEVPESPRGEDRDKAYNDLMFKRVELNAATNLKIKSILTPAQLESIGGLPDLK